MRVNAVEPTSAIPQQASLHASMPYGKPTLRLGSHFMSTMWLSLTTTFSFSHSSFWISSHAWQTLSCQHWIMHLAIDNQMKWTHCSVICPQTTCQPHVHRIMQQHAIAKRNSRAWQVCLHKGSLAGNKFLFVIWPATVIYYTEVYN